MRDSTAICQPCITEQERSERLREIFVISEPAGGPHSPQPQSM